MARAYDRSLVDRMQAGVSHVVEDGLLIELRPVPDDDRQHALDPRVYEATLPKLSFAGKDLPLGDVHAVRRRPAKPTLAIGAREVRSETRLAWMGGHGIYVHLWIPNGLPEKAPVAVYLHGGFFAFGSVDERAHLLARLAELGDCVVAYPEYRLSGELRALFG